MGLSSDQLTDILDIYAVPMIMSMGLSHWFIDIAVRNLDGDAAANCAVDSGYDRAYIKIDPAKFDDEEDVLRTLRHELLHLAHHQFYIYRDGVGQAAADECVRDVLDASFNNACEVCVRHQEVMLNSLGLTPYRLAQIGNKMRAELGSTRPHKPRKRGSKPRPANRPTERH